MTLNLFCGWRQIVIVRFARGLRWAEWPLNSSRWWHGRRRAETPIGGTIIGMIVALPFTHVSVLLKHRHRD